jgi:hypothetical protein
MANAPKDNGDESDDADEPLYTSKLVFEWADGNDASAPTGLEGNQ